MSTRGIGALLTTAGALLLGACGGGGGGGSAPAYPPATGTGGLVTTFGTSGVVSADPSTGDDDLLAVLSDGTDLYLIGYDESPGAGNFQWRIEKRSLATGALVGTFGTSGVITSNPSTADDSPWGAVHDGTNLYVVGYDEANGAGNSQWRIEKRLLSTGALVAGFGTGGVLVAEFSTLDDQATAVVQDGTNLYVAGYDYSPGAGDWQWRVEKRTLASGALVTGFNTTGVKTSNPSAGDDEALHLVSDGTNLYVVGYDEVAGAGDPAWRIEATAMSNGGAVGGFGTAGAVRGNPSAGADQALRAALIGGDLFVGGFDTVPGGGDSRWRLEKRSTTSGALVAGFGSAGVVSVNPSTGQEYGGAFTDGTRLYLGGSDSSQWTGGGNFEWRLDRRSPTSGGLVSAFGSGGVRWSNPSGRDDEPNDLLIDATHLYAAGYDGVPGVGDFRWRLEKRTK